MLQSFERSKALQIFEKQLEEERAQIESRLSTQEKRSSSLMRLGSFLVSLVMAGSLFVFILT